MSGKTLGTELRVDVKIRNDRGRHQTLDQTMKAGLVNSWAAVLQPYCQNTKLAISDKDKISMKPL